MNEEGRTFVIRAGDKFEVVGSNDLGEMALATPALIGDRLILRTEKHLYSIPKSRRNKLRQIARLNTGPHQGSGQAANGNTEQSLQTGNAAKAGHKTFQGLPPNSSGANSARY
jgi:hypothetical protein